MAYKYKMINTTDVSVPFSGALKPDVRQRRETGGKIRKKK